MGRSRSKSRSKSHGRSRSRSPSQGRHSQGRRSYSRSQSPDDDGFRVYVGDLGPDPSKRELEKLFEKFGPVMEVWVAKNPPCFAFIVYKHKEDAEDAIRDMNGVEVSGHRVRCSLALPRSRGRKRPSGFDPNMRCYSCGERGHFSRDCNQVWRFRSRRFSRSHSRSRSRDRDRNRRSKTRSRSRSKERRRPHRNSARSDRSRSHDRGRSSGGYR